MNENPYTSATSSLPSEFIAGVEASAGRRFWTCVIDSLTLRIGFFVLEIVYAAYSLDAYMNFASSFWWWITYFSFYAVYYISLESLFGRTLGKALVGTRVLSNDGKVPGFASIVIRTASRFIPLEPVSFSISETWWHDSLSNTKVVCVRKPATQS
jgi:uncharacterized RDD family membrane protein YckC